MLQRGNNDIDIALGWHPWFLSGDIPTGIACLEEALVAYQASVSASGEVGLDATITTPMSSQEQWLSAQLEVASNWRLPVIFHHLKTHHRLPSMIKQCGIGRGVIHAFSGNATVAKQYIELGMLLGVGGTITYPRGEKTRGAIKAVGLENLLLETDSPDMPAYGYQGERNEPERITQIVSVLSELFDIPSGEVVRQTTQNYHRLFTPKSQTQ